MQIGRNIKKEPTTFEELRDGDVFLKDNDTDLYMKVEHNGFKHKNSGFHANTVLLQTGVLYNTSALTTVRLLSKAILLPEGE